MLESIRGVRRSTDAGDVGTLGCDRLLNEHRECLFGDSGAMAVVVWKGDRLDVGELAALDDCFYLNDTVANVDC